VVLFALGSPLVWLALLTAALSTVGLGRRDEWLLGRLVPPPYVRERGEASIARCFPQGDGECAAGQEVERREERPARSAGEAAVW
jgi:hypothetical protein